MTPADQTTPEERKPLLDLSDLVDRRDFIIGPDGETYYLRTDGLSAIQHHRLLHITDRHDELFRQDKLTAAESKELESLLSEMLGIILDAPAAVRKQIKGSKARELVRHFQRASQPDSEREQEIMRALLAGMLQSQDTEPDGSSTTES